MPIRATHSYQSRMRNMGGKMKVARIVVALVATVVAALAVVGTASADPPGMTYNSSVPGMTYNDMTYN
jgi:hypothetical protein